MNETKTCREVPLPYKTLLTAYGGLNRFGEPMFRIVWGWNRMVQRGAVWHDSVRGDIAEYRWMPKYGEDKGNRWIIETWLPPEAYGSPWRWEREMKDPDSGLLTDGPYPSRGDYECVCILEVEKPATLFCGNGKQVFVTEAMELSMGFIEGAINELRRKQGKTLNQRRQAIVERERLKDLAWESRADAILDNAMPPVWAQQPHSYTGQQHRGKDAMPVTQVAHEGQYRPGGRQVN